MALIYVLIIYERGKGGKPIAQHELVSLLNAEEVLLVDVRPAKEFAEGHIHGAINIPHTKLASRYIELERQPPKALVVADQYGQHAGSAGKLLADKGYDVRRLDGGIMEWRSENLPLVKGT
ncbi:MAG TPA: rhodanese-like domain-containing protein [Porticoccaceae bacterium]|nr:rhodanese-like domain-containing protein [Porticoccaceae bacterium]